MSKPRGYDILFGGATHRYFCDCGAVFSSKDPREAHLSYKEHKKTCTGVRKLDEEMEK